MLSSLLLLGALASAPGPFPILADKGQKDVVGQPAGSEPADGLKRKRFHVPHQLSTVEKLYRQEFTGETGIAISRKTEDGTEEVIIESHRAGDRWSKAILTDQGVSTVIEVVPLMVMGPTQVNGQGAPVLTVVIERSAHVGEQLRSIDQDHEAAAK